MPVIRTQGTSPKAKLAALLPAVGAALAIVIQWLVTGELDKAELVTALTGLSAAVLAFAGAWLGAAGQVIEDAGSDSMLPADVRARTST